MSVELYFHPNSTQPQPKIWGYENGSINTVFFGKITDTWNVQEKAPNYGRNKASEKQRDGYLHVGTFATMAEAEGFRTAYNNARSSMRYAYDGNNSSQRAFAQALSQIGFSVQASSGTPAPVSAPVKVQTAPKTAPAVKAPVAIDWTLDDDSLCLL